MFRRLVATSRAPQIMVLSMLRSFGKIGPQIDQIWAWLSRGHRWSPGVWNPLKSSVTGPSLLVNCYLEIKFHKIIRVNPPPPLTRGEAKGYYGDFIMGDIQNLFALSRLAITSLHTRYIGFWWEIAITALHTRYIGFWWEISAQLGIMVFSEVEHNVRIFSY